MSKKDTLSEEFKASINFDDLDAATQEIVRDAVREMRKTILKEGRTPRGHILKGVFKQVLDHPDPVQEAEKTATMTVAAAGGMSGWAARMDRRLRLSARWMVALRDTMDYGIEAFQQVADEAVVEDETDEVAATNVEAPLKGKDRTDA